MAAYIPTRQGTFGTSGDPKVATNYNGDTLPAAGDELVIRGHAVNIFGADMDQGATINLDILHFTNTYLGSVGVNGDPWLLDTGILYYEGGGAECWLDTGIAPECADVYVNTDQRGANALQLNTTTAGTINRLHLMRGRVTLGSTGTVDQAVVAANRPTEGILVVNGATMTLLLVDQGKVLWQGNTGAATVNMGAGEVIQSGGTITTMNMWGGRFTPQQGTMTTINIIGPAAILDLTQIVSDLAITTINLYRGGYLRPSTLQLLASSITVNYRTPGEHGQPFGETDTWG